MESGVSSENGACIVASVYTYPVAVANRITIGLDPGLHAVTMKLTYKEKEVCLLVGCLTCQQQASVSQRADPHRQIYVLPH